MRTDSKAARYILLASISFAIVMFGTRFVTLRFGQVFSEQSPAEKNRIAALEARIQVMEGRLAELDSASARIASLEEANKHLRDEVQAVKSAKSVTIYQITKNAPSSATDPSLGANTVDAQSSGTALNDNQSQTVHRGDSMQKVRRIFGRPTKVVNLYRSERWEYGEFRKSITFTDTGVSEWSEMPIEP